jgi:hypothetical protein
MTASVQTQSEYRDLPIDWLVESPTNPRQTFDEDGMQELPASIREHGVLQPLLVRPHAERRFEIIFGARRYRGAAMAERETVPVCIREMTDAQVLEAQLVENLQRRDVHPLHEAQGKHRSEHLVCIFGWTRLQDSVWIESICRFDLWLSEIHFPCGKCLLDFNCKINRSSSLSFRTPSI